MSRYSWAGAAQRDVDETCSEFEARVAREATRRGFERTARQVVLGDEHFPDTVRIQVANAARRYPQLLVALSHNRISLTVAGLVASNVDESNADELVSACEGKSKRDAEEYLVSIRPKPVYRPSIRKQATRASSPPSTPEPAHASPPEPPPPKSKPVVQPAAPEVFNFRFAADKTFKEKFERLAEVLGVDNAQKQMAEILEQALDVALDKKDPKRKLERRQARKAAGSSPSPDEVAPDEPATSRYVASATRERVLARAGFQCEYRARDAKRCTSRTGLQLEHTNPFAIYRSHDERYLRAYCPAHNRLAAKRFYGAAFIERKIQQRAPNGT
jgi:hypothetical protein